jgi:hypothetical protein
VVSVFNLDGTIPMIAAILASSRVAGEKHLLCEYTGALWVRGTVHRPPKTALEITQLFGSYVPWTSAAYEERDYFAMGLRAAPLARLGYEREIRRQVRAFLARQPRLRSFDRLFCSQNTKFDVHLTTRAERSILIEHGGAEYKTWRDMPKTLPGAKARLEDALILARLMPPRLRCDEFWACLPASGATVYPIDEQRRIVGDVFAFFLAEFGRRYPKALADLHRVREELARSPRASIYLAAIGVPPEAYPAYLKQEFAAAEIDSARDTVFIKYHPVRPLALRETFASQGVRTVEFAEPINAFLPVELLAHFLGPRVRVIGSMSTALLYARLWCGNEAILTFVPDGPSNALYAFEYNGVLEHFREICPPALRARYQARFLAS